MAIVRLKFLLIGLSGNPTLTASEQRAIKTAFATATGLSFTDYTMAVASSILTLRFQATTAITAAQLASKVSTTFVVLVGGQAVTLTVATAASRLGFLIVTTLTPTGSLSQGGGSNGGASIVPMAAGAGAAVVVLAVLGYVYYRRNSNTAPQLTEEEVRQKRKQIVQATAPAMPVARTGFQRFRDPDKRFDEGSSGPPKPKAKRKSKVQQQVAKARRQGNAPDIKQARVPRPVGDRAQMKRM